jgi:circadian clock protein KaiC
MELATSGISGLDAQLGGGFPRGATVLVLGDPCNALSVFAEQFTAGGLSRGETALYFQFDRPAQGAPERVKALAQDMGGAKGSLRVFDGYTATFPTNGKNGSDHAIHLLPAKNALGEVLNEALKAGAATYRLAIDSLSSAARGNDEEMVEFFRNLVHVGHETGALQMVTLVKGLHSPQTEARLKHLATGVMEMGVEKKGFGLYNYLQVTKLLDLRDPTRLLLFKETDKGLWLESTKRVF